MHLPICCEKEFKMINIVSLQPQHWNAVKKIYEQGIESGNATFETQAPTWEQWDKAHKLICRIVATQNEEVVGWAALTPVSSRFVYEGVAEVSVYVATAARGKKIGTLLLQNLITQSEEHKIWTLQSGIFPENKASISMHTNNGFRIIGYRERIGKLGNIWRDNMLLERRSSKVDGDVK
jgi:L-amino acid N-acyltransferase YncA